MSVATMPQADKPKKTPGEKYASIKVREGIVKKARLVAAHEGASIGELLSDILEPVIDRKYEKFRQDIAKEG